MRRLSFVAGLLFSTTAEAACAVGGREVSFGTVDTTRRTLGTGEIRVDCDRPTGFEVGLGGGSGAGRALRGPDGAVLRYQLYQDVSRNVGWGDGGSSGAVRASTTDDRGKATLTVYGTIPAQPGTPPGSYEDRLQITLIF